MRESARYERYSMAKHVAVPATRGDSDGLNAQAMILDHDCRQSGNSCFYPYSLLTLSGYSMLENEELYGNVNVHSPSGQESAFFFCRNLPEGADGVHNGVDTQLVRLALRNLDSASKAYLGQEPFVPLFSEVMWRLQQCFAGSRSFGMAQRDVSVSNVGHRKTKKDHGSFLVPGHQNPSDGRSSVAAMHMGQDCRGG